MNGSLRQSLKLENKFVVGFCGNHGVAQGLPSIMEAADLLRQHEDVAFLFVGEGPVKQQLLDTKQLKNLDNVLLLPQVPIEEISGYINSCDVMLVPLRKDAIFASFIPSKMFDYMACAKALVLTVDGEARGILEESGAGVYVEPEQPQALRDALINHDSLVKTPSSSGGNGRIMWGKGVGAAPGRGRGACSERETRKRASGSPSSW